MYCACFCKVASIRASVLHSIGVISFSLFEREEIVFSLSMGEGMEVVTLTTIRGLFTELSAPPSEDDRVICRLPLPAAPPPMPCFFELGVSDKEENDLLPTFWVWVVVSVKGKACMEELEPKVGLRALPEDPKLLRGGDIVPAPNGVSMADAYDDRPND